MKILKRREFGDSILRQKAEPVEKNSIGSDEILTLISDMRNTLIAKKLGVALAAPQVGKSIRLVVVAVRPTKHRPKIKELDLVMINPEITDKIGKRQGMWEGCISSGKDDKAGLFAIVPRYDKIKVKYQDEDAIFHHRTYTGLRAQIVQHEVDHLNGKLFVDRVRDTKTFMTYDEYMKMANE